MWCKGYEERREVTVARFGAGSDLNGELAWGEAWGFAFFFGEKRGDEE
jgi:hypothetical protein